MKKNNMLRIASVLLVAVLLSTCAISGAFAKYVDSEIGSDSARVALFGAEIDAENVTFFTNLETGTVNSATANTVYHATDDLVAPGTSGEADGIAFDGVSEVAVAISYSADITLDTADWTTDNGVTEYCPIIFTVGTEDYMINPADDDMDTIAELILAVEGAVAALGRQEYAAGTDLGDATIVQPTISWRWAFDADYDVPDTDPSYDATKVPATTQDNAKDTLLGKAGTAEITIAVTATVTQID